MRWELTSIEENELNTVAELCVMFAVLLLTLPGAVRKPMTFVGTKRCVIVPSPNFPEELFPQHITSSLSNNAHVWDNPAAIWRAVVPCGN
jgi:hypothetical protein